VASCVHKHCVTRCGGPGSSNHSDQRQCLHVCAWGGNRSVDTKTQTTAVCSPTGRAFPTVMLLGAQKAGSTSLFQSMVQSMPALLSPKVPPALQKLDPSYTKKELHFFNNVTRYSSGAELYASYFPSCNKLGGRIPIDGTPNYFSPEGSWSRASEFFSREVAAEEKYKLKFVITVRDPVDRYISAFEHFCVRRKLGGPYCTSLLESVTNSTTDPGCVNMTEQSSVHQGKVRCASMLLMFGIYWLPLEGWVEAFPQASFVVTTFNHYIRDPNFVLETIGRVIGTPEQKVASAAHTNTAKHRLPEDADHKTARALLRNYYEAHNDRFWNLLRKYGASPHHQVTFTGENGVY